MADQLNVKNETGSHTTKEESGFLQGDPDYLISQSTFKCLTLLSGSGPEDATIGLAGPMRSPEQQWLHDGNALLYGPNPSYCLIPNCTDNVVTLGDASTSDVEWIHDEKERFVPKDGNKGMDVPNKQPHIKVILYKKTDGQNQKWWTLSEIYASLDGVPPAEYPIQLEDEIIYDQEICRGVANQLSPLSEPLPYERDLETFPGVVSPDETRVNRSVMLDLSVLGQVRDLRMTVPKDWQATNIYVAAGDIVEVVLPESLTPERAKQIQVRVSAHTDKLKPTSGTVKGRGRWDRMPIVSETFELVPGVNKIRGQYGGHLIFMFNEGKNFVVNITVRNVVEAPYFRLGETTKESWQKELEEQNTPYALLETEKVVILVAKSDALAITEPDTLTKRYDEVIEMLTFAAGFEESDPPPRGKYWLVNGKQISAGSAHAGFPVMFDRKYQNLANEKIPYSWVTWHECGHDYQQGPYWDHAYGSESTVNLYSLYIQWQLFGEDRLAERGHYNSAADRVDAGMTFDEGNVWERLVFLMEIKWAFPEQDWGMFRQLRKITRALSEEDAEILKSEKQNQIDHVYKNLSKIVGADLINTYNRWSLTISQEAQDEIAALELPKAQGDLSHRIPE